MRSSRKKRLWFWLGFPALAASAVTGLYLTGPLRWLGQPTVAILSSPTSVETFKLNGLDRQQQEPPNTIAGYPIVARGQTIQGSNAARLGRSLMSPGDYVFGNLDVAACKISPGVGFRFWRGRQSVDVVVCFLCGHIVVDTRDERGRVVHRYLAPFGVQRLTGFVRRAFPNDPDMQGALSMYEMREK